MQSKLPLLRSFTKKHPRLTLLLSAVVLLAALAVISRARFDTDVTRLIPGHAEKTAAISRSSRPRGMEDLHCFLQTASWTTQAIDAAAKR
jgi:hypothetical protein